MTTDMTDLTEDSVDMTEGSVAIYLPDLAGGGAQRVNVNLANELARRGLAVDFVTDHAEGPFRTLIADSVRLVALGRRRFGPNLSGLCRYVTGERPDVVMASMTHASVAALLAKRLVGGRTRFLVQCQDTMSVHYTTFRPIARLWIRLFGSLLPSADAVVAVSKGVADDLVRMFPKASRNVVSIYNPVFEPGIIERAEEPLAHPWFGDPKVPVVLSVGRLAPQKDHNTLLAAFAQVVRARRARLVIAGDGPDRTSLLARAEELGIAELVDLPGFQSNPYPLMKNAQVFVLSSIHEGLPLVLVEALACGTPVVSTDCPNGPREVLEDGKWGQLVPMGDAQTMADAILSALDEPADPSALVARARCFSARSIALEYIRVFFPDGRGTNHLGSPQATEPRRQQAKTVEPTRGES